MKKIKAYLDITGITTLEEYYTKKSITKALAGIPQTRKEVNQLIENITTSVVDELFRGNTVAVYKNGNVLVRIPKDAVINMPDNTVKEEPKKEGFFKRLWRFLTGK